MSDSPSIIWATDSGEVDLTATVGDGYRWWLSMPGPEGLGMPAITSWDGEASLMDGGVWSGARLQSRRIMLPLAIDSDTFAGRQAARRALSAAVMPGGRPVEGRLVVRAADGTTRELRKVRFSGGLDEGDVRHGLTARRAACGGQVSAARLTWTGGQPASFTHTSPGRACSLVAVRTASSSSPHGSAANHGPSSSGRA